jgi:protein-S-isoprenylcysteine O-methyltransferase Ste14
VSERSGWRWGNVPLPETYLAGLGAGLVLQVTAPWRPPWPAGVGRAVGWPLLLAGLALAAWAVRTAANVDLGHPGRLVWAGPTPSAGTRCMSPQAAVYVRIALVANAAWPLLLLPAVLLATHLVVVREERFLEGRFGAVYRSYRTSVRRYL